MKNDPIVEEMRQHGMAFTQRHHNDLAEICRVLREQEVRSGRPVASPPPRRSPHLQPDARTNIQVAP